MGRRAAREMAMKLLYQMEIQKDDIEGYSEIWITMIHGCQGYLSWQQMVFFRV